MPCTLFSYLFHRSTPHGPFALFSFLVLFHMTATTTRYLWVSTRACSMFFLLLNPQIRTLLCVNLCFDAMHPILHTGCTSPCPPAFLFPFLSVYCPWCVPFECCFCHSLSFCLPLSLSLSSLCQSCLLRSSVCVSILSFFPFIIH